MDGLSMREGAPRRTARAMRAMAVARALRRTARTGMSDPGNRVGVRRTTRCATVNGAPRA